MRITTVTPLAVRIPRDLIKAIGTAGSPAAFGNVGGSSRYRWAETYRTVYATAIETTVVRVDTDAGLIGWGEAQSPVAPEVTCAIIESLLGPLVTGDDPLAPEPLWDRLYGAMRVRGQTGGFFLDAIAAIDTAVWDICGKALGQPVSRLLGGPETADLPCYISGLAGTTLDEQVEDAGAHIQRGARAFKVFLGGTTRECLTLVDRLREAFGERVEIFVDALWRLTTKSAIRFAGDLQARGVGWLEAPLMPEDVQGHRRVTASVEIPIAIGESYRSRFELLPFFEARALDVLQPDLGRTGLTEGRRIAALAGAFHVPLAPHISIGLGPQIAAALHFSAATSNLQVVECNPQVYEVANQFLRRPIPFSADRLTLPAGAGLGIELDEVALQRFVVRGGGRSQ